MTSEQKKAMEAAAERFFSKVKYSDGCWEWQAYKSPKGYGYFGVKQKTMRAHRWAYEYFREPLFGLHCCHHCDNPSCVNPFHLYAGTNADNTRDRDSKGRQWNKVKRYCKRGHKFDSKNTGEYTRGVTAILRTCKRCLSLRGKWYYAKKKERTDLGFDEYVSLKKKGAPDLIGYDKDGNPLKIDVKKEGE